MLSNRLKRVLNEVIGQRQSVFQEGRYLLHSALVIKDKVDYEKVYDSINWKLLLYMLKRLGFKEK